MSQINKPTDYFNTVTYTGDGTNGQNITGVGFQPDLCWIKSRSAAQEQMWYDSVRGADKLLRSNDTYAEATTSTTTYFTSFDSDGFTVGSETALGGTSASLVGWNFLAGGTASSNTDGSITSQVSANTTSGFSIVTWTGAGSAGTVGHGLGSAPKFIIIKKRNNTGNWGCYHASLGSTKYLYFNATSASATYSGFWNDTDPTSSVISLGTDDNVTGSGDDIVAYCFAEKKGFSKFGSYTGNGAENFIYTGFKPAFFLVKNISSGTQDWFIYDNKRDSNNVMQTRLRPNKSDAENTNTAYYMDFLSNGMCLKTGNTGFNGSGNSFIYMAFAEQPLVGTNNIPATAR